ncbi:MAG: NAD(P)H-dependent oxidoreductase [Chloroflexota bacterium]
MSDVTPIHVVAICGSLREISYTEMALRIALTGAKEVGATTHLITLRDYDLSFCEGPVDGKDDDRLREDVAKAQGIILGTPVYHGGMSGVLKNALDLMGSDEFSGRVVGLVGVAGGSMGAALTLASLRNIGRSLHSWVIPNEASIPNSKDAFRDDEQPHDLKIQKRLLTVGRDVARFAYMHHSEQTLDFVRAWERSMENPGTES